MNLNILDETLYILNNIKESKDESNIDSNFKKKTGLHFKTIDLYDPKALNYISEKWLEDNKIGEIIICIEDNVIAGYCLCNKSGTIAPLMVYRKYRGYGLSEILMKDIINKYGGFKLGVYSDNEVAIRLYKKLGFVEIDKKIYKDGDVVIIMQLKNSIKESSISESYIINEPDIYYNKDKFDSGGINLCFITGHSGSGKSTMGRDATKRNNNVEHYELDDLFCIAEKFTMNNLKEYGDLIYSYFNGVGKRFYITFEDIKNTPMSEYEDKLLPGFIDYCKQYAKNHKDKKFIIEGVQLFGHNGDNKTRYFSPQDFKDYAFYIKGTSMIISKLRAAKRDSQDAKNEKERNKAFRNNFFKKNWKYYIIDEKDIKVFRDYFKRLVK